MPNPGTLRYNRFLSQAGQEGGSRRFASAAAGQAVLITGAGGYIGSALAMALAAAGPAKMLLLDSSEQGLYGIEQRLEAARSGVPVEFALGSVTDAGLLGRLLGRARPAVVYHAAAFKQVPMLESNPVAAVRNNALGTYTLAQAALESGVATLVLVSTDKAVNPRSIMGATKRMAELTVTALSGPRTRMNAVRLGNVIGSTGSVIPLFREQIARREPVTVTDPEASRYFLSLRDAVEAILAGGAAECSGRILLPELGEPERIVDIARFLIDAAGDGAGDEIPIRMIGLRPGEKLQEELTFPTESCDGCAAGGLKTMVTPAPAPAELHARMEQLARHAASGDVAGLVAAITAMVPEYEPSSVVRAAVCAGGRAGR